MESKVGLNFLEVHSCQPSFGLLTSCRKCCASNQGEVAKTWLFRRPTKTPENWRESHSSSSSNNNNNNNNNILMCKFLKMLKCK